MAEFVKNHQCLPINEHEVIINYKSNASVYIRRAERENSERLDKYTNKV